MKKVLLIFLSIFGLLFLIITFMKIKTPLVEESNAKINLQEAIERENVMKFWNLYREATKLRMSGEWEQASNKYAEALKLNDQHTDALYYYGNMQMELSHDRKAEQAWRKILQIYPGSSRANFQLGNLYLNSAELFDIGKAESAFRMTMEINKEETGSLLRLGQVLLIKGQLVEAKKCFNAVTGSNFKSIEAYYCSGYISWKQGNPEEALALFGQAIRYSKPKKRQEGILGEGDTKTGKSFERSGFFNLFSPFLSDLGEMSDLNKEVLKKQMGDRYITLEQFLDNLTLQ